MLGSTTRKWLNTLNKICIVQNLSLICTPRCCSRTWASRCFSLSEKRARSCSLMPATRQFAPKTFEIVCIICVDESHGYRYISPVAVFANKQNTNAIILRVFQMCSVTLDKGHPIVLSSNKRPNRKERTKKCPLLSSWQQTLDPGFSRANELKNAGNLS